MAQSAIDMGTRPMSITETEDLQPLTSAAKELRECSQKLQSDDWSVQYRGLDVCPPNFAALGEVRCMAVHYNSYRTVM
jgi:hypothetical protein